jgi:phosphatidate cytidylyltransferase
MFLTVSLISLSTMLIGALAFALLNRKSNKEKSRERNIKLATYILMVFTIYASIAFVPWLLYIITAFLIFTALREISNAADKAGRKPYSALLIGGIILYFFAQFIKSTNFEIQLFTYFIIAHFDGFSQVIGESYGNHKILPQISPGKTRAGLLGGILISFIVALIVFKFNPFVLNIGEVLILTAIIITSGFLGDVLASWYKRRCGIKNYSKLIPGHGGVLDRFDSFFMAGAVIQVLQMFYSHP